MTNHNKRWSRRNDFGDKIIVTDTEWQGAAHRNYKIILFPLHRHNTCALRIESQYTLMCVRVFVIEWTISFQSNEWSKWQAKETTTKKRDDNNDNVAVVIVVVGALRYEMQVDVDASQWKSIKWNATGQRKLRLTKLKYCGREWMERQWHSFPQKPFHSRRCVVSSYLQVILISRPLATSPELLAKWRSGVYNLSARIK